MTAKRKEIKKKQSCGVLPKHNEWPEHTDNCFAAATCPKCGNYFFTDEGLVDRGLRILIYSECSTCDWKNYDYLDMPPLDQPKSQFEFV